MEPVRTNGAFVACEGFEPALVRELERLGAIGVACPSPGLVVATKIPEGPLDPVFALQPLPGAMRLEAPSVAKLAKAAFDTIAAPIDGAGPWTFHAFAAAPDDARNEGLASRATLVGQELLALAKKLRRRSHRNLVEPSLLAPSATPLVVQLCLTGRGEAWVSCARPRPLATFGLDLDPRYPGGRRPVLEDKTAPSSAHKKAQEGYLFLGEEPRAGDRCVDLGASPGGWSWTALERGARVLAVDRAALLPPAAGHPLLEERRADAFEFEPEAQVDWLLCDVIAAPARTIELIDRWLGKRLCRRFVVNVKFRGDDRENDLAALRAVLAKHPARVRVKHLVNDKNEVTAFGLV